MQIPVRTPECGLWFFHAPHRYGWFWNRKDCSGGRRKKYPLRDLRPVAPPFLDPIGRVKQ